MFFKSVLWIVFFLLFWGSPMNASSVSIESKKNDINFKLLSEKNIFFAHQSVGRNIIEGMRELISESPDKMNIISFEGALRIKSHGFYHTNISKNGEPKTKINDFYSLLSHAKNKPDIAFLKLCFVDVTANTDIDALFSFYKEMFLKIKQENPDTIIIHFTVPLKVSGVSWKTKIKSMLGRKNWEFADNIKRNQFNRLLLAEYQGKDPVFNVAEIESTHRDGLRETFEQSGQKYFALTQNYSSDGGHLNKAGKRWVAENLIHYLSSL